jgi:hypothetical protein
VVGSVGVPCQRSSRERRSVRLLVIESGGRGTKDARGRTKTHIRRCWRQER